MSDVANTTSTLTGLFKEVYADKLETLTPAGIIFQKDFSFVPKEKQPGNYYHQPVLLSHEHGFTYAAAGSDAFALIPANPGATKDAQVLGSQMLLKSWVGYEAAARAASKGKNAFQSSVGIVVENMWASTKKRVEIDLLYGRQGLGVISTISKADSTTATMTISKATWAPGIWAGQENTEIEFYDAVTATANKHEVSFTVTAIDLTARTVTFRAGTRGTESGDNGDVVVSDHVWFRSQRTATAHNTFAGLYDILVNASTIFNIDAAAYSLWKANSYAVGGALTFQKIQKAVAQAMGKGLDEDLTLYINPGAWADLLSDEAAMRRHVKGGKEAAYSAGASGIQFYSQNGLITIKGSIYVKEGIAFLIAPKLFKRIGATDITFKLPDRGDEFFRHVEATAAYELRNYVNQALFSPAPGKATLLTGIVNST